MMGEKLNILESFAASLGVEAERDSQRSPSGIGLVRRRTGSGAMFIMLYALVENDEQIAVIGESLADDARNGTLWDNEHASGGGSDEG